MLTTHAWGHADAEAVHVGGNAYVVRVFDPNGYIYWVGVYDDQLEYSIEFARRFRDKKVADAKAAALILSGVCETKSNRET